jgi:Fe-S-cluster containining protein
LHHCLNCPKDVFCCSYDESEGFVFVGLDTARNIKAATGKEFKEFLDYSKLSKEIIDDCRDDTERSEGRLRYAEMKDGKILRLKMHGGDCIFCKKDLCTIYDVRPFICRMYPYWFEKKGDKINIILHDDESECAIANKKALEQSEELVATARMILEEKEEYLKGIQEFVKRNNLM